MDIKEYRKKYYEDNKTKILSAILKPEKCIYCGRTVTHQNIIKHQKTTLCKKFRDSEKFKSFDNIVHLVETNNCVDFTDEIKNIISQMSITQKENEIKKLEKEDKKKQKALRKLEKLKEQENKTDNDINITNNEESNNLSDDLKI